MADRVHNYDYPVDLNSNTAAAKVIRFVGENKRVLEVGCGPGSITKYLKNQNNCSVVGFELDPDAIQLVTSYCDEVLAVDLNNADWQSLASRVGRFQAVVAADVLEHLYDPWHVLAQFHSLLDVDGEVVVSLPHVGHAAIAACLLNGSFEYKDWGLLDRTHIRFFGLSDIDALFQASSYKIVDVSFVLTHPEETEFASVWSQLDAMTKSILHKPVHSDVYQVVVKAVPSDRQVDSLSVASAIHAFTSQGRPSASTLTKFKSIVRRFINN